MCVCDGHKKEIVRNCNDDVYSVSIHVSFHCWFQMMSEFHREIVAILTSSGHLSGFRPGREITLQALLHPTITGYFRYTKMSAFPKGLQVARFHVDHSDDGRSTSSRRWSGPRRWWTMDTLDFSLVC